MSPSPSRRQVLEQFVAAHPQDAFGRYGLAVECAQAGDHGAAVEHFRQLLAAHPNYVAGYFQYGQLLARLARTAEAKEILSSGIGVAQKYGDQHAANEMSAALAELG
jgi:tetratricopeptide (TPR) repeat protein